MFVGFLAVLYIDIGTCQFGVIKTSGSVPVSVSIILKLDISRTLNGFTENLVYERLMVLIDSCSQP